MKLKNLTGQRFGMLIVLGDTGKRRGGKVIWKCRCDCGEVCDKCGKELTNGDTKSCGNHRHIDETGKRYGKLVVNKIHKRQTSSCGKRVSIMWECVCDCGRVKVVLGESLRKGNTKSCGECGKLPKGMAAFNNFFYKLEQGAKERGLVWLLEKEQVRTITSSNCFYCGKSPSQEFRIQTNSGSYIYNGIDRVDNKVGYVFDNCVACCKQCNYAKGAYSKQEFFYWVKRVYKHLKF